MHRARTTIRWLNQKSIRLFLGDRWPPNSPDVNPIEHLWPLVTEQLSGKVFSGKEALWTALQVAFASIPRERVLHLYESMPSRLAALKLARGGAHSVLAMPQWGTRMLQQCWKHCPSFPLRLGPLPAHHLPPHTGPLPFRKKGRTKTYA